MSTKWIERFTSDYAKEKGFIDYGAIARAIKWDTGGLILANTAGTNAMYEAEAVTGDMYTYHDEDGNEVSYEEYLENDAVYDMEFKDFYQYYIVSHRAVDILEEFDEVVIYDEENDLYFWCVTHLGTGWDYVLTDVEIKGE